MTLDVLVEPDDRGRVSLSKIPGANVDRYVGRRLPDGSILLQPAVVMSHQALRSLLQVQSRASTGPRQSIPLGEVLDRRGRTKPSPERLEAARADMARRRAAGERSLADITPEERQALGEGRGGGLSLG